MENTENMDDTLLMESIDNGYEVGPYNYCDYRCNRCTVKEHCRVYARETDEEEDQVQPNWDSNNDDEMENLVNESLKKAMQMFRVYVEENNIDLSKLKINENNNFEEVREKILNLEAVQLSHTFREETADFVNHFRKRYLIPSSLTEAFSDLEWYHTLIPVKMERSLHSLHDFLEDSKEYELEDAYLTSFIIRKALRKSLTAVEVLKESLMDYQETLQQLESLLIKIHYIFKHQYPFEIFISLLLRARQAVDPEHTAQTVKN